MQIANVLEFCLQFWMVLALWTLGVQCWKLVLICTARAPTEKYLARSPIPRAGESGKIGAASDDEDIFILSHFSIHIPFLGSLHVS